MNDALSGHCKHRAAHEQGSRDLRLFIMATAVWCSTLASQWLFRRTFSETTRQSGFGTHEGLRYRSVLAMMTFPAAIVVVSSTGLCLMAAIICLVVAFRRLRNRDDSRFPKRGGPVCRNQVVLWFSVLVCCCLTAFIVSFVADLRSWHDPAIQAANYQSHRLTEVEVEVLSPVTASKTWGGDCQVRARMRSIDRDDVVEKSASTTRLILSGTACGNVENGQTLQVSGLIEPARFGPEATWLTVPTTGTVKIMDKGPFIQQISTHMQQAFVEVCDRLSDQGRVLVPGLTIGVLGQDIVANPEVAHEPINPTFASLLERDFKRAGIMHLMAVSGGHFAIVTDLTVTICSSMLMHRRAKACIQALACLLLAALMYPSDSVLRAVIMGVLTALCRWVGRPSQTLNMLGLTVVIVLISNPSMARSYGFALSCCSVAGIELCSDKISAGLESVMPHPLADSVAATCSAQLFTLPIQVMISPQLPLLSIPANLIVSPFVDFSTICGLCGLMLAWCCRPLAFMFVWLAACGTWVMQRCAVLAGGSGKTQLPWSGGFRGAMLILFLEITFIGLLQTLRLLVKRAMWRADDGEPTFSTPSGSPLRTSIWQRSKIWVLETKSLLSSLEWRDRQ